MSKLETQRALPRHKLYRQALADVLAIRAQQKAIVTPKPKRKAKKAKKAKAAVLTTDQAREREILEFPAEFESPFIAQLKWTVEDADRALRSAEITKFQTQSVEIRRGRKLTKRKAKKAKGKR